MPWSEMVAALSRPQAYPVPPRSVDVRHTHISVVFLADGLVYKIKKPLDLGFLDFSTPALRHHFCEEEVRLNRRLAPDVYLGVVPVARDAAGALRFEGAGEAVEWAVKMRRLPDEATLLARLGRGALTPGHLAALGRRIAAFHLAAPGGPAIAVHGAPEVVSRNALENLEQSRGHVGKTLTPALWERVRRETEQALARLTPLIAARAARGMTRDVHGDLHLDHVYLFPDAAPPADLAVLDCVEFSDAYRCGDVVSDMAFLCMDLCFQGRRDLMEVFAESYFAATGDGEGRGLLPFYAAYRAAVRAKVEGFKALEPEIPEGERAQAADGASAHWLHALSWLLPPASRPALALTGGLPGTGKSRLARELEERAGFFRISSDVARKELAGLAPTDSAKADFGAGIYTEAWNERTYGECLRRAEELLRDGRRVVVDASFREEAQRRRFLDLAGRLALPARFFLRTAPDEVLYERLARRGKGSVSDADWAVSRQAAQRWEPFSPATGAAVTEIGHFADRNEPLRRALAALKADGVA